MSVPPDSGPAPTRVEENPLLDGLRIEPTPTPTALVIFGASGDLTRRQLLPARFNVVGVARTPMNDDQFRQQFHDSLKEFAGLDAPDEVSSALAANLGYIDGEMDDPGLYRRLTDKLSEMRCPDGVLFYL